MSKHKSDGKKKKKGSQLVIRLDKDERDTFVALCDKLDTSAAREIRRFMRDWVVANMTKDEVEPVTEQVVAETSEAVAEAAPSDAASSVTVASQNDAAIETESKPKAKRKAAAK